MRKAIEVAKQGLEYDEVPIGAIIVKDNEIIAQAHNLKVTKNNSVYHAEIIAIGQASQKLGWRLNGCEMYVTLEPCSMCAGAIINSRIDKIVFGAYDPKAGCCGSLYNIPADNRFNHTAEVIGGVLALECGEILSDFFRKKRLEHKERKKGQL